MSCYEPLVYTHINVCTPIFFLASTASSQQDLTNQTTEAQKSVQTCDSKQTTKSIVMRLPHVLPWRRLKALMRQHLELKSACRILGVGWPTCRSCCLRCKKAVQDAKFSHLGPQNLNVGPQFSPVGRAVYYFHCFTISFPLGSRPENLHLGPQNLNVGPRFSPVGRAVYYFYYFTISFPLGSRQEIFASRVAQPECRTTIFTGRPAVLASRAAKPECRTTIFTGRPGRLLFHFHWVPGRGFLHLGPQNLNVGPRFSAVRRTVYDFTILLFHFHWVPGRRFLHLGQPSLHVSSRFCMPAKRIRVVYTQICKYVYIYIDTNMYIYIDIYTGTCVNVYVHIYTQCIYTYIHTHIYIYIHIHTYIHMYLYS